MSQWNSIMGLVKEIKRCEGAGATMAAIALGYICIDTMALLAMPGGKNSQDRQDFIAWVDTYLKNHPDQPYQYRGIDVYAARCAVLHAYGSEADLHRKDSAIKMFGYHDGGKHAYDPKESERLVVIGTASFLNDVVIALESFLKACQSDGDLRKRVEERLPRVLQTFPFPS